MESIQKKPSRPASSSARDGGEGQVYGMGEMRELKVSIRSIGIYRRERTYLTYAVACQKGFTPLTILSMAVVLMATWEALSRWMAATTPQYGIFDSSIE
jgi:hypothetical protein